MTATKGSGAPPVVARQLGPVERDMGPRLASVIHSTRRALGWSIHELGHRAGVAPAQISRIERGEARHGHIDDVARLADALGVRLDVVIRPPVLMEPPDQHDAAHARVVAYATRHLGRAGIVIEREVPIGADRVRGWIDILGSDPRRDTLVVGEGKGDLDDVGALERQISWYEREAPAVARRLGWPVHRDRITLVAMLASRHNVELIRANRDLLRSRFDGSAAELRAILAGTAAPRTGRFLVLVDPLRRGPAWLIGTPLERGRPVAPYATARSFVEHPRGGRR
jgi:transcriptional regulator with XRE-family HTH domain